MMLARRLAELGWSKAHLGRVIKTDPAAISHWIAGHYEPSLQAALRLDEAGVMEIHAWKQT